MKLYSVLPLLILQVVLAAYATSETGKSHDVHCHRNHKAVREDCSGTLYLIVDRPGEGTRWGWGTNSCAIVVWQTLHSQNVSGSNIQSIAEDIINSCFEGEKSKKSGVVQATDENPKVCVCGMNNINACYK
ncbi:hypothetical protein V1517DRAFT_319998 [Lipomyces orientalis]|uniref:Uncharacterized protein n=1 Tax=Lipomyces orientalis TaxID=1233043 RepID=A0ACC3TS65_9ASCO